VALITHPREKLLATGPEHVVNGPDHVCVRTWSTEPVVSARGRVDDEASFDLLPLADNIWAHPLPGDELTKGEHTLAVLVEDAKRQQGSQQITFMVDATRRYTAIPRVHPVVTRTKFC
jgi:3',5'-cyclic-AMP phosphodiesterase